MVEDAIGLERRRQRRPVARRIVSVELAIASDRSKGQIVAELDVEVGRDAPAVDRAGQRRLPRRAAVARRQVDIAFVADVGAVAERIEREWAIRRVADEVRAGRRAIRHAIEKIGRQIAGTRIGLTWRRRLADIEQGGWPGSAIVFDDVGDQVERDPFGRLPADGETSGEIFLATFGAEHAVVP